MNKNEMTEEPRREEQPRENPRPANRRAASSIEAGASKKKVAAKASGAKKAEAADGSERLQKLLSRAGVASRRAAEEIIAAGQVTVNGAVVKELGAKADPRVDKIVVNGKPIMLSDGAPTVVLLHKPRGYVSTKSDPQGRATVIDLMPRKLQHLNPVGRLDFDTSGVLLLTDDGELLHLLTHPSHGVEKVYHARVGGKVLPDTVKKLETGIFIVEDEQHVKTAPCRVQVRAQTENNALVEIILREGRNRQVRKMLEAVGHRVSSLRRVRFADLELDELGSGAYRILLPGEVHALRKATEKSVQKKQRANEARKAAAKSSPRKPLAGRPAASKTGAASRETDNATGYGASARAGARTGSSSRMAARGGSERSSSTRSSSARPSADRSSSDRSSSTRPADSRSSAAGSSSSRYSPPRSSETQGSNARKPDSTERASRNTGPKKPAPMGEKIRRTWK